MQFNREFSCKTDFFAIFKIYSCKFPGGVVKLLHHIKAANPFKEERETTTMSIKNQYLLSVLDGLKAGDEIVSEGAGLVREGTQVK